MLEPYEKEFFVKGGWVFLLVCMVLIILSSVGMLTGCSAESGLQVNEEEYSVVTGTSVSIDPPKDKVNVDIQTPLKLKTAYFNGSVNTVVTFELMDDNYQFGYDTENSISSSDGINLYNAVGHQIGVMLFTLEDEKLQNEKEFMHSVGSYTWNGTRTTVKSQEYPYAYFISDYNLMAGTRVESEVNLHILFLMKNENDFVDFIKDMDFGINSTGEGYCSYQKDILGVCKLSEESPYYLRGVKTVGKDKKYQTSIAIETNKKDIGVIYCTKEAIDVSKMKNKDFKYTTKNGLQIEGIYFTKKKGKTTFYCYEVGTIKKSNNILGEDILLFMLYDKSSFKKFIEGLEL